MAGACDANFKRLRLALKLLQRWPQLWPNARSKSLQPSAPRRPLRASQAEQLRARRPLAKPKRARPPQSSAAKLWAQASAAATFTRPPFYKGARGESTKRRGQLVPQSKALSPNRRSCAFKRGTYLQLLALKSLQPWPQLWPNARSKSLQPSAPRWPSRVSQAKQLRARRPVAKPQRPRPPQSRAVKLWAPVCNSTCSAAKRRGRRCDSLHSNRRRIRMRISSVCAAGLLSTRDQALPLSLALPGSKLKP